MKNILLIAAAIVLIGAGIYFIQTGYSAESEQAMEIAKPLFAHLDAENTADFDAIRTAFTQNNPGYDMEYVSKQFSCSSRDKDQIVFIQEGGGTVEIRGGKSSKVSVGDIVWLRKGQMFTADSALSFLSFQVPDTPSDSIPAVIRPDWDMNITDVPGGCATETGAYRRILLTWKDKVGPYLYHSLNAHRVRIMDSFSHYHPVKGGFDEFYLVQMALPEAKLITSTQTSRIENPATVTPEVANSLLQSHSLRVGDLVYLPRGVVHRGVGGVLAQVITVPGFVPGSEIGVDHHLKKINEILQLSRKAKLPLNVEASASAIIK